MMGFTQDEVNLLMEGQRPPDQIMDDNLYLKIPNYTIQTIYWEYIEQLTKEWNKDVLIDMREQKNAIW